MYNLTSFCFAGTKIRINLVFSVSLKKEEHQDHWRGEISSERKYKTYVHKIFYIINALTCNRLQLCIDLYRSGFLTLFLQN